MAAVIFLMGPTASGKSALALELAEQGPFDIISVDSAMVYRGMDIGTAKPSLEVRSQIPHYLIDCCDAKEIYSAAKFREDALKQIERSLASSRIPLLVGGTMLYFHALQRGLHALPSSDVAVRQRLVQRMTEEGLAVLHEELHQKDPIAAARISPNDPQRLLRALEVHELTGQPLSTLQQAERTVLPYTVHAFALAGGERTELHRKIAERFHGMLQQGLMDEVRGFYERGDLTPDLPSMRAVGYRQIWAYLAGQYDYNTMIDKAIVATRQLAKRQWTWLRRVQDLTWLDTSDDRRAILHKVRDAHQRT